MTLCYLPLPADCPQRPSIESHFLPALSGAEDGENGCTNCVNSPDSCSVKHPDKKRIKIEMYLTGAAYILTAEVLSLFVSGKNKKEKANFYGTFNTDLKKKKSSNLYQLQIDCFVFCQVFCFCVTATLSRSVTFQQFPMTVGSRKV